MSVRNTLLFFIVCLVFGCYKESDYNSSARHLGNLFSVSTSMDSIPADGMSRMYVYVNGLPDSISAIDNNISLQTDFGTFVSGTAQTITVQSSLVYDSVVNTLKRQAMAVLVSSTTVDSAHIIVLVKGVTKTATVFFYRALPDRIKMIPSAIYAKASYIPAATIEVDLIRDTGLVSLNTPVILTAVDTSGNAVGAFQLFSNLSDSNGKTNFIYVQADTSFTGPIHFTASAAAPSGGSINSSFDLNIYK
ncbi:MAG TPA: hypothetical protein VK772_16300 [Puia sp.]|jgi:hypothetical protein|nr:hypothetical protein [Puia sp.]